MRARFEEFLALEQAGWKGRKGTALASSAATAEFARAMLFDLAEAGKARIDSLQGRRASGGDRRQPDRRRRRLHLEDRL